jgi:hypothetical protein
MQYGITINLIETWAQKWLNPDWIRVTPPALAIQIYWDLPNPDHPHEIGTYISQRQ